MVAATGGHAGDYAVFVHGGYGLVTGAPNHAAGEGYGLDFHGGCSRSVA